MRLGPFLRERVVEPLRRAQGTPESVARGAALGTWIALTPTVGAQMLIAGILAVPMRANVAVALALTWITNPVTVVPGYYAFYRVGTFVLGKPDEGFPELAGRFRALFAEPEVGPGLLANVEALGVGVLWPLVVGSFVVATTVAIPTYHVVLWILRWRRARRLLVRLEQRRLRAVQRLGKPTSGGSHT